MLYLPNIEINNAPHTKVARMQDRRWALVTTKSFEPNEIVLDFNGFDQFWFRIPMSRLDRKQIARNWYIPDGDYCHTCQKVTKFNYIHHSLQPNCLWYISDKLIKAARYIEQNEEITIDFRVEIRTGADRFPDTF
jgi:hypothetical protein